MCYNYSSCNRSVVHVTVYSYTISNTNSAAISNTNSMTNSVTTSNNNNDDGAVVGIGTEVAGMVGPSLYASLGYCGVVG